MIRVLKWFPFENKLSGLDFKETAKRYHRDTHKYEWYAEGNWKSLLSVKSKKYPMEFSAANFKETQVNTFLCDVIKLQNSLPKDTAEEESINGFEKILGKVMKETFTKVY